MPATQTILTDELREAIRAHFPKYPTRRAVVLPALHLVEERLGCVPPPAVVEIAGLLDLHPAEVQDTLSFYGFFEQDKPRGRLRVWVCRSLACACRGGEDLLEYLCERLAVRPGETAEDGAVSLEFAECLGACDLAPAMLAGDELIGNLTREKIDAFVAGLRRGPRSPESAE
ncbi:MAG: NAD(P)H-dependent oxidoreductase subunit E [Thermoguttaceae bacterium]|jgi:NADH-quinone oxidoreductase subunit E